MQCTGDNMSRKTSGIFAALLLLSCIPMVVLPVSGESTNHVTFSGGFATVDVQLQGNITNSSAVLELPRNVTVTSSTFQISYDSDDESPGTVWIDINQDGVIEWEYDGIGYGDLGQQNVFYDGNTSYSAEIFGANTPTPTILLPAVGQSRNSG